MTAYIFYFFLRERDRAWAGRGGDTESGTGYRLCVVSIEHNTGIKLTNPEIMT